MRERRKEAANRRQGPVDLDGDGIPDIIPKVVFDPKTGEPIIAREMAVSPSPVPRSLAFFVLVMVVISVVYTFVQQSQRNSDLEAQRSGDKALLEQLATTQRDLAVAQGALAAAQESATLERERLRALVLAVLAANTPAESRKALQDFIDGEKKQTAVPQTTPSVFIAPAPGASTAEDTRSQASPPVSRRPSPSPQPRPSTQPRPSPSASRTAAPIVMLPPVLPSSLRTCLRGLICT